MKILNNIIFMLKYPMKYISPQFIFYLIIEIFQDLNGVLLEILLVKLVVDAVQFGVGFKMIFFEIMLFGLYFFIFQFIYNRFISHTWEKAKLKLNYETQLKLTDMARKIEIRFYDDEKFYDKCMKSVNIFEGKLSETITCCSQLLNMLLRIVFVISLLSIINIFIMLMVVFSCVLSVLLNFLNNKINYKKFLDSIKYERRSNYVNKIFSGFAFAKDIRLYKTFPKLLFSEYGNMNTEKRKLVKKYWKPLFIIHMCVDYVLNSFLLRGIVILFIAYQIIITKSMPYSAFAIIIPSILDLNDSMTNLGNVISQFKTLDYHIANIREFIDYKSEFRTTDSNMCPIPTASKVLELKNVSFAYDNKLILNNISLKISPNEKLAIVGLNGAGKSTLIKLIMRLYDPQSGEILLDNKNIKEYDIDDYYFYFSTVFQDFRIFAVNVAENILMDLEREEDRDTLNTAVHLSGFDQVLKTSGSGNFDSQMTKEFSDGGLILSGGELQKLALSRAFTRKHPVLILDEPSSALDPISEYEINQKLLTCCDNTIIFISHRLSTTKMADRIILISDGKIIEQGSHQYLMDMNGEFAQMFNLQAKNYKNKFDKERNTVLYESNV